MNIKRNTYTNHPIFQFLLKWISLILIVLSMLSLPSIATADEAEAGKVIFIFGQAWKHSTDGGKHDLKRGMVVRVGETIETSSNGQVQIRMNDNGLVAIRPGSQFKIQAFKFSGSEGAGSSDDKSYFQLLKGGFRSITGVVGQRNKKAYKVSTPVATIGIRGTDYTARLCDADCQQVDGLYMAVWQGGVNLDNEAGVANIDAGQYGYVAGPDVSPVPVQSLPAELLVSTGVADDSVAQANDGVASEPLAIVDATPEIFVSPVVSLPKTGSASYTMTSVTGTHTVGGVDSGNTFIGGTSADLTADFTNQSVDASVNISLSDGGNWQGSAAGMQLNFDGSFASNGAGSGTTTNYLTETGSNGGGSISGQMTGLGDGTTPTGATLNVNMWDTFPTTGDEAIDAQFTLQ